MTRPLPLSTTVSALALLIPLTASGELRFPGFFGDHMVVQRQAPIPVWGWAEPDETVTVQLGDDAAQAVKAIADASGRWRVELPPREATDAGLKLTASSAADSVTLSDILVGEVWLCSGQSNMEWSVAASLNPQQEIAAADFPAIRHVKIGHKISPVPLDDVSAAWRICSPETAGSFTGVGYSMARELHRELGVAVGLINISWGGTRIEPWTPVEGFASNPALAEVFQQVSLTLPDSEPYRASLRKHIDATAQWLASARSALENGASASANPEFPAGLMPLTKHTDPTTIYNAMMHPVVGYGMRGAIWYQGESNHADGMLYFEKKKALLAGWRELWGIGDFPFYFVQIAPFAYQNEAPAVLPVFWEAQTACLKIPNTAMVVTNDIGNPKNIHPRNKQEVGRRLALLALKHQYGKPDVVASGPVFESMRIGGDTLHLKFIDTAGGLKSRDGEELTHFEIIGEQGEFEPAKARIRGDTIVLSAAEVRQPAAMRFAWHNSAEPNLVNGAGLPASAFRAGEVPEYDYLAVKVPESASYQLVYDLDLKELGPQIRYQVDRSAEFASPFDRIGYFIELKGKDGALQWAWAAMDAFTDDLSKIGVPTARSGASFQSPVTNLNVLSSLDSVSGGAGLIGNLEFWPNNYKSTNSGKVPGASSQIWDFGDQPMGPVLGYGSMQIHHTTAKQTIFAINHWRSGPNADIGIGNSPGPNMDWTFVNNAKHYQAGRLRVLIREVAPP